MNITLNKNSATDGLLTVALSEEDYLPGVTKKIKDYTRKATIKGFRKGKVPSGIINKMYGKPILAEEVNKIVSRSIAKYIADNNLKVIGNPLPNKEKAGTIDWDLQKEFTFEFQLGLVDNFTYTLSPKVKLTSYRIEASDGTIDEAIEHLQNQFGQVVHPEISELTDRLSGEVIDGGEPPKKHPVNIDIKDLNKDAQQKFIGIKVGDQIGFDTNTLFASQEHKAQFLRLLSQEDNPSKKSVHQFKVDTISRTNPAKVNRSLFDKVFGKDKVQDKTDFTAKVKERIEQQYQQETDRLLNRHIEQYFIENTSLKMPEDFLKVWLQQESNYKAESKELNNALEIHKKTLKWDLIKNKIAEDLAIQVNPEEVKQVAKELIANQYRHANPTQLDNNLDAMATQYLSADKGSNFTRLQEHLLTQRILTAIKKKITITEQLVSITDFKKIAEKK